MRQDPNRTARRIIEETQVIRLSVDDQRAFVDAILSPPAPNDAMRRAARCAPRPCPRHAVTIAVRLALRADRDGHSRLRPYPITSSH